MLKEFVRTEFELGCGGPTTVGRLQDIARNRTCDTHHGWLPVIKVFLKWPVSASLMRRSLTFQCVVDWTSIERMVLHDTIRRFTPRDEQHAAQSFRTTRIASARISEKFTVRTTDQIVPDNLLPAVLEKIPYSWEGPKETLS